MKKVWLLISLCLLFSFTGLLCSAEEDLHNVEITEYPSPYTIRVVDQEGTPVPNIYLDVLLMDIGRLDYDYSMQKSGGYSDENGLITLWLPDDISPISARLSAGKDDFLEQGIRFRELTKK